MTKVTLCTSCGLLFGGPKTMILHDGESGCLDPAGVGLVQFESSVWYKPSPEDAATLHDRRVPHPDRINILNGFGS